MLIKHYGFEFPPTGIISILEKVNVPRDAVFYILDPLTGNELPYQEIAQQSNPWVIITTHEGASHRWFDRLIPALNQCGVNNNHIIIRSACLWDPDSSVKHIHTIVDECTDFVGGLDTNQHNAGAPTHHYVCLNRLHRWQRYALVKQLLDRDLAKYGCISYLESPPDCDSKFPLILDQATVDWQAQRRITHPAITGALFQIICETAYESEPGVDRATSHYRPGMTEKSYKCFALYQIPIWLAPFRAVECYRGLGFDVFDDIVDHSYDLVKDPTQRIELVVNQIEQIVKLTNLPNLKRQLLPRFQNNLQRLYYYNFNLDSELTQWKAIFAN